MFRKTLSLFGCLALFVLHSTPPAGKLVVEADDLAGRCQWEWWRNLWSPAGRAMPCIKLLPLPPFRGRHWPVGGFQQCGVCVLNSCCSLSVVRIFFVLRADLLVSFPEGMVSCKPGRVLEPEICVFCGLRWVQSRCGCIGRRFSLLGRAMLGQLVVVAINYDFVRTDKSYDLARYAK